MNRSSPHQAAPFLVKTYDIVDDVTTNSVIAWAADGASFIVYKPVEFSRDLLPKYFKHSNFSSFVRQLNTYGFRKVDSEQWQFANEGFIRGEQELLPTILRRKPASSHASTSHDSLTSAHTSQAVPGPQQSQQLAPNFNGLSSNMAMPYGGPLQYPGPQGGFSGPQFPQDSAKPPVNWMGSGNTFQHQAFPGNLGPAPGGSDQKPYHLFADGPNNMVGQPPPWVFSQMQHQMLQMQHFNSMQQHFQNQLHPPLQRPAQGGLPRLPAPGTPSSGPRNSQEPSSQANTDSDVRRPSLATSEPGQQSLAVVKREDSGRPLPGPQALPRNFSGLHQHESQHPSSCATSLQSPAESDGPLPPALGTSRFDHHPELSAGGDQTTSTCTFDSADSKHRKRKLNLEWASLGDHARSEEPPLDRASLSSGNGAPHPGETMVSSELLQSVLNSVGKLSMDVARLKHENQALSDTLCTLDQPGGKDGPGSGVPHETGGAVGRAQQLEARLKAQEDWKASVDAGLAAQAKWQAAIDKSSQDTTDWRTQHAARTLNLQGQLAEQRHLADRELMRARQLEQRLAWQEKLSHDQLEMNQRMAGMAAEQSRKASADHMAAAELQERLALQERQHAQQRALNRMLEARLLHLEGQLSQTASNPQAPKQGASADGAPKLGFSKAAMEVSLALSDPGPQGEGGHDPCDECESVTHVASPPERKLPPRKQFGHKEHAIFSNMQAMAE